MSRAHAVVRAFDAAGNYDAHAHVQGAVAQWLADYLVGLPAPARVLEVGCGTGDLAQRVLGRLAGVDWLMTDIAPTMLERARRRFAARPQLRFAVLDGEHPDLAEPPFDLICASLAVQWFTDLEAGLGRLFGLLAPGGDLVVTTLTAGTFAAWRESHHAAGVLPGTPDYPSADQLATLRVGGTAPDLLVREFAEHHASAAHFLRALKAIGAGTPRPDYRPLAPASLRAVARQFEQGGAVATYRVARLHFRRPIA